MKFGYILFAASVIWSHTTNAQSISGVQTTSAPISAPASAGTPPASCELHIFPTNVYINSSYDYGLPSSGIAGAIIGDAITHGQQSGTGKLIAPGLAQMQSMLSPEIQVEEMKAAGVLSLLKLPPDTKIVVEAPLPSEDQTKSDPSLKGYYDKYTHAFKKNVAISTSSSPCYRELFVGYASLSKNLGSLKFNASFVYRTFDRDLSETHLYDGERTTAKPEHFPATKEDEMAAAQADVRKAFSFTFTDWIAHRVKL